MPRTLVTDFAEQLARIVERQQASKYSGSVALAVSTGDRRVAWSGGAGPRSDSDSRPMDGASPYLIASATKLYTTAILLQLVDEGALSLADRAAQVIPGTDLSGIHVIRGEDYSQGITVKQLMSHTSGLADYFEQKQIGGGRLVDELIAGRDRAWTLEDVLALNRDRLKPHFPPGTPGKAVYSDTNYQILGAIIEQRTGMAYADAIRTRVLEPLGLANTYVFTQREMDRYDSIAAMKWGMGLLRIPRAMTSFGVDGGIVSTADESMVFLRAFMRGELFQRQHLDAIQDWKRIFFPLQYGIGIMKFELPWFFSPFKKFPPLIGHSGASGTVMFHCPALDLYLCGTVNQVKKRDLPYRMMMQVAGLFA